MRIFNRNTPSGVHHNSVSQTTPAGNVPPGSGALGNCPAHPSVPLMEYNRQPWCQFCAANRFAYVNRYCNWLYPCLWALVLAVPLCVLASVGFVPVVPGLSSGAQPRLFWWWILPITAFLSSCVAIAVGHGLIRIAYSLKLTHIPLAPWFHPTHALRDWSLVAAFSSPLYWLLLTYSQQVPLFNRPAEQLWEWFFLRGTLIGMVTFVIIVFLESVNWITRDAVLPEAAPQRKYRYAAFYAVLLAAFYLPIQGQLTNLALQRIGIVPFMLALTIAVGAFIIYHALRSLLKMEAKRLGPPQTGPIPATIAIVGASSAGKTVFLGRSYSLFQTIRGTGINLNPTPQSQVVIDQILQLLHQQRTWPGGTVNTALIPFSLQYGLKEVIEFTWLDLPGGAFTDSNKAQYRAEAEFFDQHLVNADAVAILIDAQDVAKALGQEPILHEHIYYEVAQKLYTRLKAIGSGARAVPLAIIVTKSCRVDSLTRLRIRRRLQSLVDHWHLLATQCSLPKPPVEIFLTSAVITTSAANEIPLAPDPIKSEQCVESVAWLAAQVMRAHVGLLDHVHGFGGHSDLLQSISKLESLSTHKGVFR